MRWIFVVMGLLLLTLAAFGQDNDNEYDKWKEIAREYKKNPLLLKDKIEGYEKALEALQNRNEQYENENQQLRQQLANAQAVNASLSEEVNTLRQQLKAMQEEKQQQAALPKFYVQLGAYQYFDINHYFQQVQCMQVQIDDQLNKYVVGQFNDLDLARRFRDDIRKLGIEDAWVVSTINGERVSMREALEQMEAAGQISPEEVAMWLEIFPD